VLVHPPSPSSRLAGSPAQRFSGIVVVFRDVVERHMRRRRLLLLARWRAEDSALVCVRGVTRGVVREMLSGRVMRWLGRAGRRVEVRCMVGGLDPKLFVVLISADVEKAPAAGDPASSLPLGPLAAFVSPSLLGS
jgi:hypothetical protein